MTSDESWRQKVEATSFANSQFELQSTVTAKTASKPIFNTTSNFKFGKRRMKEEMEAMQRNEISQA